MQPHQKKNKFYYSNGGRVLSIVCQDKKLIEARKKAYDIIKKLSWNNGFFRTDIGVDN